MNLWKMKTCDNLFSDNVESSSKKLQKMISADIKRDVKDWAAVS